MKALCIDGPKLGQMIASSTKYFDFPFQDLSCDNTVYWCPGDYLLPTYSTLRYEYRELRRNGVAYPVWVLSEASKDIIRAMLAKALGTQEDIFRVQHVARGFSYE